MTMKKKSAATEWHELRERVAVALWIHHGVMLREFRIRSEWQQVTPTMKSNMRRRAQSHIIQLRCLGVSCSRQEVPKLSD